MEAKINTNAIWKPVGNFGYPCGTHGQLEPVAIVDHIAQGTMAGMDAWFANPVSKASAHFAVGKLGQVHQYVDLGDAAWANGKKDRPDSTIPWMAAGNPNLVTVSVEHEGKTGEAWTEAMYAADLALHRWLVGIFNIPIDDNHIVGHYRIDSVNRARCPGTGWPKARLFQDLEEDDMDRATFNKWFNENVDAWARQALPKLLYDPTTLHTLQRQVSGAAVRGCTKLGQPSEVQKRINAAIRGHAKEPHGGGGGPTVEQVKAIIRNTKLSP